MNEAQVFALGIVLAWLAGVRAYLTVFGLGVAGYFGWIELPGALDACTSPWVMGVSALLAAAEFAADKIPGVDSGWDLAQTLLRVPAGAFLASAALAGPDGDLSGGWAVAGGAAALLSHSLKSGARALVNTSPEPVSNFAVSSTEDAFALGALGLAFAYPWLAFGLIAVGALVIALLLYWIGRRLFFRRKLSAARNMA
jgi:hypothetical protein